MKQNKKRSEGSIVGNSLPAFTQRDERFMLRALELAELAASLGEVPVGAVIVKGDEIIAEGCNRRELDRLATAHAELLAIEQACKRLGGWRLSGCTLYVTLEPCPMCAGAIINSRIDRVVSAAKDPKAGALGSLVNLNFYPFNHHPRVEYGLCEKQAREQLQNFFALLREKRERKTAAKASDEAASSEASPSGEKPDITIKSIGEDRACDINLPNEAFPIHGRMLPFYDGKWSYTVEHFTEETEMVFPDESYSYADMKSEHIFIGAYSGGECVGLAIYRRSWNKYLYLYDLKVNRDFRRHGIGRALIDEGMKLARQQGYRGIHTTAQDNNLDACLFYISCGFELGGLDTKVYTGTKQSEKRDIFFYLDGAAY